jgi:hypothetical protein
MLLNQLKIKQIKTSIFNKSKIINIHILNQKYFLKIDQKIDGARNKFHILHFTLHVEMMKTTDIKDKVKNNYEKFKKLFFPVGTNA